MKIGNYWVYKTQHEQLDGSSLSTFDTLRIERDTIIGENSFSILEGTKFGLDFRAILAAAILPIVFVASIWLVKLSEILFDLKYVKYGTLPGKFDGIKGILISPLIHSDLHHIISNTIPLLLLGIIIAYFYKNSAPKVFLLAYFLPSIFVWLFARSSYHIGSSGIIYTFVTFLFFSGIFRRNPKSIILAIFVAVIYGSLLDGIIPLENGISWETHLFGAVTGLLAAIFFRNYESPQILESTDLQVEKEQV